MRTVCMYEYVIALIELIERGLKPLANCRDSYERISTLVGFLAIATGKMCKNTE